MRFILWYGIVYKQISTTLVNFPVPAALTLAHKAATARWLTKLALAAAGEKSQGKLHFAFRNSDVYSAWSLVVYYLASLWLLDKAATYIVICSMGSVLIFGILGGDSYSGAGWKQPYTCTKTWCCLGSTNPFQTLNIKSQNGLGWKWT